MSQRENLLQVLRKIKTQTQSILDELEHATEVALLTQRILSLSKVISGIGEAIPNEIYLEYQEFFDTFCTFCERCADVTFMKLHVDDMESSLSLFIECMEDMEMKCARKIKQCPCCGQEVVYAPLSDYYSEMEKKFHVLSNGRLETLNREEYSCPNCGASDRDRMILSFLKKEKLRDAAEGTRVLQIAPSTVISRWILKYCPQIVYETTDLFMEDVTFCSDLQDMNSVADESYDVLICSHVLEHVQDDKKALKELKRILKPEGKLIFLVPVDLNREDIDEEWGLSEAENWRRFGQGDHCRAYGKKGLLDRLQEQFYVNSLGMEYFGAETFEQYALTDTSILYVLTKSETVSLELGEKIITNEIFCREGPLVSVILPCYNHEEFVAEAIESVLNQTYKNIEFIVADDGSTDGTAAVMQRYSQYFTKEIYLKENTATGIVKELEQNAAGKYIALMHSDDIWEPNKLELQISYLEEHEECGACLTWCMGIDRHMEEIDNTVFLKTNQSREEWMRYFWEHGNAFCNPSSVIRRDLGITDGMNPYRQLPDFFKWIEMVQYTEIHIIPKVLVQMRWHPNEKVENTSAPTKINQLRQEVELGSGWLDVIRRMKPEFFVKAFQNLMCDPSARTEEEIQCEKFFLLLNHDSVFVQNSAWCYLAEIYRNAEQCLVEKYHYTKRDIPDDMVKKGFAGLLSVE